MIWSVNLLYISYLLLLDEINRVQVKNKIKVCQDQDKTKTRQDRTSTPQIHLKIHKCLDKISHLLHNYNCINNFMNMF